MENHMESNRIAYNIIKTQIEFGTYCFGEQLPTLEDMAEFLFVSLDTVRHAYHRLQDEGYILLFSRTGTIVSINYTEEEIEQHIQAFFSDRKDTILDISSSMPVLLGNIQVASWQKMPPGDVAKLEEYIAKNLLLPPYLALLSLKSIYKALKNDLLTELIYKLNIVYVLPFLDLRDHEKYLDSDYNVIPKLVHFYRQKNWDALYTSTISGMNAHLSTLQNLYETRIAVPIPDKQTTFTWSSYKKASQVCYTVGGTILNYIMQGIYPAGSYLPSLKNLAMEKKVSVSTIRHVLALLNDLGVVKTINGIGTQVLSIEEAVKKLNVSSQTTQKRLLDCKQSLQLFALSCRDVAALTIRSIDEKTKTLWLEQLYRAEQMQNYDLVYTISIKFISQAAPYRTIRTIYTELYELLFWGAPLRGMMGTQEYLNTYFRPYYHTMCNALKNSDADGFAAKLEEILQYKFKTISQQLKELGVTDPEDMAI